jgi:hypothetical protein
MSLITTRAPAPHPIRPPSVLPRAAAVVAAPFLPAHGAVHAMGVALPWELGEAGHLRYSDAGPIPGTAGGHLAALGRLVADALVRLLVTGIRLRSVCCGARS